MSEKNRQNYSFSQLYVWGTARSKFFGALGRGISTLSSLLIVAALSVYQYGLYQLVLSAIAVSESFTSGLFDDVVMNDLARGFAAKRLAWAKRLFDEIFLLKVLIGFLVFAVIYFGAGLIASYYGQDIAGFVRLVSVLALLKMVRSAEGMFFGATRSFVAFGAGLVQEILRLALLAAFWFWGGLGIREVLLSTILAAAAILVYISFFFVREYRKVLGGVIAERKHVLFGILRQLGGWVVLRYGFSKSFKQMDAWFIRFFLNTEAVGFYTMTVNLIVMVQTVFPLSMLSGLLPWEVDNERRFQYIYRRGMKYFFWSGVIVSVSAFLAVPAAVEIFLPKYLPAMPLFRIFVLTLPLYGVYKFQKIVLIVLREQKILAMRLLTEAVVTAGIWIVTLPLIGLFAAVVEFFITYGGRVALYLWYLPRRYPFLKLKLSHFVVFDRTDLEFLKRMAGEVVRPARWLKPIRVNIE